MITDEQITNRLTARFRQLNIVRASNATEAAMSIVWPIIKELQERKNYATGLLEDRQLIKYTGWEDQRKQPFG